LTRLSGLTRAAAVVLTAKSNSRLKHIEFVRLEPERALVVLVGEDGQVENRVLALRPAFPHRTHGSHQFSNARIRGRTLAEARLELETALTQNRAELDQLTQKVIAAGIASWSGGESDDRQLIVRGQRQPAGRICMRLKISSGSDCCSTIFETKRGVIDLWAARSAPKACGFSSDRKTSCFRCSGSSTIIAPYGDARVILSAFSA